jgi:E1A/CREB-binding protein
MAMLYELHTQNRDSSFMYTCNTCKAHVETRWHCNVCEDFDLCVQCYEKEQHMHKLEKLGFDMDSEVSEAQRQQNPQEARRLSVQKCIQSLVHACQCRDANCRIAACQKMKRVVMHAKSCQRKMNGGCPICKQLITLCCYHAKHCTETKCPVPFCPNIKLKLQQQQADNRMREAQMMRRRLAQMPSQINATPSSSVPASPASSVAQGGTNGAAGNGGGGKGGGLGGGGGKGGGLGKPSEGKVQPPAKAVLAAQQVSLAALRQSTAAAAASPSVALSGQPTASATSGLASVGSPPAVNSTTTLTDPSVQWSPAAGQNQPSAAAGGSQQPNANAIAIQRLLETLKSPQSPQQHQEAVNIIRRNPQLLAFIQKVRHCLVAVFTLLCLLKKYVS